MYVVQIQYPRSNLTTRFEESFRDLLVQSLNFDNEEPKGQNRKFGQGHIHSKPMGELDEKLDLWNNSSYVALRKQ